MSNQPVPVVPKTKAQQVRTALYTWITAAGMAAVTIGGIIDKSPAQIRVLFPRQADTILAIGGILSIAGGVGATSGIAALGNQRQGGVDQVTHVDLSPAGAAAVDSDHVSEPQS